MPPLLLAILACGPGPVDLSTVTDTRVISIQGEPPEVYPGERTTLTITVANPLDRELEVLAWTCVPWEERCLEEDALPDLSAQASIDPVEAGEVRSTRRVPDVPATLPAEIQGEEIPEWIPVQIWALACPVDDCDLVRQVRAALREDPLLPERRDPAFFQTEPTRRDAANAAIDAAFYDPTTWMDALPVDGVSLTTKTLRIARPDRADRNHNPVVEARFLAALEERLVVDRGTVLELGFWVDDPDRDKVYAHGYTTLGRFEDRREKVDDGVVRLYLDAPNDAGEGEVWVVFEDERGGSAVWHMPLRVR